MDSTLIEQHGFSNLVEAATALATFSLQSSAPVLTHDHAGDTVYFDRNVTTPTVVSEIVQNGTTESLLTSLNPLHHVHPIAEKLGTPIGSNKETFPGRLMAILNDDTVCRDVISWLPNGRSFIIARPDIFMDEILPKYITSSQQKQDARSVSTKYPSFTRKLNRWGFRQITRGPETGAFHNPLFRRDKPELCLEMVCQRSRPTVNSDRRSSTGCPVKKRRISSLTKESLEAMNQQETTLYVPATHIQTAALKPATVSDDSHSMRSSISDNSPTTTACKNKNVPENSRPSPPILLVNGNVTNDTKLIQQAISKRNEEERMRVAKVMLYNSFLQAMNGEDY